MAPDSELLSDQLHVLADAGNVEVLADHLVALAVPSYRTEYFYPPIEAILESLPAVVQVPLVEALLDQWESTDSWPQVHLERFLAASIPRFADPDDPVARRLIAWTRARSANGRQRRRSLLKIFSRSGLPMPMDVVRATQTGPDTVASLGLNAPFVVLNPDCEWADRVQTAAAEQPQVWLPIVQFALTVSGKQPSKKWERDGRELLETAGPEAVREVLVEWLAAVNRGDCFADDLNAAALRGLIRLLSLTPPHDTSARVLADLAEDDAGSALATFVVSALGRMTGEAALAQLIRLSSRVKATNTLKAIDKALDVHAATSGRSRADLEETSVPDYGLTEVGRRIDTLGEFMVELAVAGRHTRLAWRTIGGQQVKSVPAAVRRDHGAELAALTAAVKDIKKMVAAQTERLDRLFLQERSWPYAAWRERYGDHPLVGTLARRLIWLVDDQPCGFAEGALRTVEDTAVVPAETAQVRLWHPLDRDPTEVLGWQQWLERHSITQPFKQAHREVYLLTAAERQTRDHSQRFTGHVLRQHQFHSLAVARGWRNRRRVIGSYDDPPAIRELPHWGIRAEFGIRVVDADAEWAITDHVLFCPAEGESATPIALDQVPPLAFSEVMRDVDLFVGVATVVNDPTWADGGPAGQFRDYWESYDFGGLTGIATARRELLSRLLPRLAIADRCTLEDRFLMVRGDLRSYRIHLGSGNILMVPHHQYLCIVGDPGKRNGPPLFLPFEGDRTLEIILSKAMLLAKDAAITDPDITSQFPD